MATTQRITKAHDLECSACEGFGYTRETCAEMATRYFCFGFNKGSCAFDPWNAIYVPREDQLAYRDAHSDVIDTRTLQQGSGCPKCLGTGREAQPAGL
jgi:hypothetical protein